MCLSRIVHGLLTKPERALFFRAWSRPNLTGTDPGIPGQVRYSIVPVPIPAKPAHSRTSICIYVKSIVSTYVRYPVFYFTYFST